MDDDGDDDDCGYLPKRQDRRERGEAIMPDLVFVQTGVRSWTTEKDANNTLLRVCVFFFLKFSAGARGYYEEGTRLFFISFVNVP